MTAELERRIRMMERRLGRLEHRKEHVWRNTPALDLDAGSPVDAQYLTLANHATLTQERRAVAGTGITITDGGANGDATFAANSAVGAFVPNGLIRGFGWWLPDAAATPTNFGLFKNQISGTPSTPTLSNASFRESVRRWRLALTVSGNINIVSWLSATSTHRCLWRGDSANQGGFFVAILGVSFEMNSGTRCCLGLLGGTSNGPGTTNDPSTLTQLFAVAADDTDTNLQLQHNDSSGTASKEDLGIAKSGISSRVYDIFFYAAPNASSIQYRLIRRDTAGDTGVQSVSTDLPDNTNFMGIMTHLHHEGGGQPETSLEMRGVYAEWNVGQGVEHYGYF